MNFSFLYSYVENFLSQSSFKLRLIHNLAALVICSFTKTCFRYSDVGTEVISKYSNLSSCDQVVYITNMERRGSWGLSEVPYNGCS